MLIVVYFRSHIWIFKFSYSEFSIDRFFIFNVFYYYSLILSKTITHWLYILVITIIALKISYHITFRFINVPSTFTQIPDIRVFDDTNDSRNNYYSENKNDTMMKHKGRLQGGLGRIVQWGRVSKVWWV